MNKKSKMFIFIIVSILLAVGVFMLIVYISNQYKTYENLTITTITSNYIVASSPVYMTYTYIKLNAPIYDSNGDVIDTSNINVGDTVYVIGRVSKKRESAVVKRIDDATITVAVHDSDSIYTIPEKGVEDALVYNINGNKISVSELKVGDNIYLINKIPKIDDQMGSLEDVKFIKVLNSNPDAEVQTGSEINENIINNSTDNFETKPYENIEGIMVVTNTVE